MSLMKSTPKRILLIEDHPIVRQGLSQLIHTQKNLSVCGEASSWGEAIEAVAKLTPDLAILDITLGKRMGLELTRELLCLHPSLRILVLSMHDETAYAERALRAGAHGYVMKGQASEEVVTAINRVLAGHIHVNPAIEPELLKRLLQGPGTGSESGVLTNRELEVLTLIGQGLSSEAIASRLFLSVKTIEAHRGSLRAKLHLAPGERLVEAAIRFTQNSSGT
jgi:DNA-binding NarL/FixJ family response regulator